MIINTRKGFGDLTPEDPFGGSIPNCDSYSQAGDCELCSDGYVGDGTGGCMPAFNSSQGTATDPSLACTMANGVWANNTCTSKSPTAGGLVAQPNDSITCAAAGGSWNGSKCIGNQTPQTSTDIITQLLNSITGKGVTTLPTTAAACAASGGTWNGVSCAPKQTNWLMYALIGLGVIALVKSR